jgi:hypothetical protein
MTRRETVHNEYTQEEKRRVQRDTLHGRAVGEQGAIGGRWAAESKAKVIGSGPVAYPALPPNSPWASEPLGQERPLGFSVEEMIPVGEPHELGEASFDAAGRLLPEAVEQASPSSGAGSGVIQPSPPFETAPLLFRKRRKRER